MAGGWSFSKVETWLGGWRMGVRLRPVQEIDDKKDDDGGGGIWSWKGENDICSRKGNVNLYTIIEKTHLFLR